MVLIIILGTVMFHVNLYLIFNSFIKSNENTPPPYTHTHTHRMNLNVYLPDGLYFEVRLENLITPK